MDKRWLVLGGWSLPPDILRPLFGEGAEFIDINVIMEKLIDGAGSLNRNWHLILRRSIQQQTQETFSGLAGWSTGAFCAYALRQYFPLCGTLLISAAPSFCSRDDFPFGKNPSIIKIMRRQLQQNKEAVLESFWKQCGFTEDYLQPVQTNYSADTLQSGLLFLEQVSLLPLCKTDAPLHLFHGTNDAIIPVAGARIFEEAAGASAHYYPGNHVFFLEQNAQHDIMECCKNCS